MSPTGGESLDRDIVQCHFLSSLFSGSMRGQLALKGGFAMRVAHGSERLTKDIDLAGDPAAKARIQRCVRDAVADLKASGLVADLKVTQPKQTDTTLRWKVAGSVGATDLHLTVEVSLRTKVPEAHVRTVTFEPPAAYGLPPAMVECIDGPALAASKVACLGGREAPRDVYDLHVLIKSQVYPPYELLKAYSPEGRQDLLRSVYENLEKMDYLTAKTSLLPFLPKDAADALDEDAWDTMRITVATHVEGWLRHLEEADAPAPQAALRA